MAKTTNNTTTPKTLPATASSNLAAQIEKQLEADYMAGQFGVSKTIAQKVENTPSDYVGKGVIGTTGSVSNSTGSSGQGAMDTKKGNDYATKYLNGDYSFVDGVNVKAAGTNPDGSFWYDDGSGALKQVSGNYTTPNIQNATNMLNTASNNMGNKKLSDEVLATIYEYKNRPAFSYDPTADSLYQNALNNAMKGGQMAMQDTIGQASALTGGYGSSYATSAANQAYNSFIEGAYDNMADYYNMALNAYNAEGDRLLNAYNMLSDQDKFAYQKDVDAYNRAYQEKRDAINDAYRQDYFEWEKETDARDYDEDVRRYNEGMDFEREQFSESNKQFWAGFDEGKREFDEGMALDRETFEAGQTWKKTEWDYGVEQDKINNDLARQRATYTYKSGNEKNDDDTTEESLYTLTQLDAIQKEALKRYQSGGIDAYQKYLESQGGDYSAKPFTQDDIDKIEAYVSHNADVDTMLTATDYRQQAAADASQYKPYKTQNGKTMLQDSEGNLWSIDKLVQNYANRLNGDYSIDEKTKSEMINTFRSNLIRSVQ